MLTLTSLNFNISTNRSAFITFIGRIKVRGATGPAQIGITFTQCNKTWTGLQNALNAYLRLQP